MVSNISKLSENSDFWKNQNSVEICKKITATFFLVAVIFSRDCDFFEYFWSILGGLGAFQLQLKLVGNQRDEFRVRRLALGVGHRVAEEPL